jgi:hypothetical protein
VDSLHAFALWVKSTDLSWSVTHHAWVWATCEALHFIGMSILFGCVGALDLRMLGWWKAPPVAGVNALVRWGVIGFAINLVTGILFFVGEPLQYIDNPAFRFKILFLVLAGWNVLLFYVTGVADQIEGLEPDDDTPVSAKVFAGTSLFLWVGVIFFGRMLPFLGNSF